MKKFLSIFLSLMICFSFGFLVACKNNQPSGETPSSDEQGGEVTPDPVDPTPTTKTVTVTINIVGTDGTAPTGLENTTFEVEVAENSTLSQAVDAAEGYDLAETRTSGFFTSADLNEFVASSTTVTDGATYYANYITDAELSLLEFLTGNKVQKSPTANFTGVTTIVIPKRTTVYVDDNGKYKEVKNIGQWKKDSETEVGFYGLTGITKVIMPQTLVKVGQDAFNGCSSLATVVMPSEITASSSEKVIATRAFKGCAALTSIIIPDKITEIKQSAFEGCSSLKTVKMSNTINVIEEKAFYNCSSLETVNMPTSVIVPSLGNAYIGLSTFENCSKLTSIVIPEGMTSIGKKAFKSCTNMTNVVIGNTVTAIRNEAFNGCSKLATIKMSENLAIVEKNTFANCDFAELILYDKITSIGQEAFKGSQETTIIFIKLSQSEVSQHEETGVENASVLADSSNTLTENLGYHSTWKKYASGKNYTIYYYSETPVDGMWHFDNTGKPTLWVVE